MERTIPQSPRATAPFTKEPEKEEKWKIIR